MPSAAAKGQRWKVRTKTWLERSGFAVAYLERVRWIYTARGRVPTKRDQLGADLIGVSREKTVFVQVKGGTSRRDQVAAARKAFQAFPLAPHEEQWLVLWAPRARQPEVEVVNVGPCGSFERPVIVPPRRRRKAVLPLFDARA